MKTRIDQINKAHSNRQSDEFQREFDNAIASRQSDIRAIRQHVNLLVQFKELIPHKSSEIDKCRSLFNSKLELSSNSEKEYYSALVKHFNLRFEVNLRSPHDPGSNATTSKKDICTFLDNFSFSEEI